jgi:hypothetical protein
MTKPHDAVIGAMAKMQASGYTRVSASELAHVLDIPVSEVLAHLNDSGLVTVNLRGENYIRLDKPLLDSNGVNAVRRTAYKVQTLAPKIHFSDLPKPDSPILREAD